VIMRRSDSNPIITRADIPDVPPAIVDATSVMNPGAVTYRGRTLLMLRVQTRGRETHLMMAESEDGESFEIAPRTVKIEGLGRVIGAVYHVYDPRITRIGDSNYVMFAMDTDFGCRLGVARTDDFVRFEFLGLTANDDTRNGVLFPEKHDGRYLMLERPNKLRTADGLTTGDEIWLAESDDLLNWRSVARVMGGRPHYWDEIIGSGPPPVKTRAGWLHLYHGVATHFASVNIYQAGAVLLDLDDPSRVLARTRDNILEPREPYELVGQVPNVVFPTGMIVDGSDGEGFAMEESVVRVYYGAADTCVCLATTTIAELLGAMERAS
jgi:beta-1,4-mannooligosaccharide/beta-1,4-mannosyl-N-acetylglucosamine phosphorylase